MSQPSPTDLLAAPQVLDGFTRMPLAAFWAAHRPQAALYVPGRPGTAPQLLCQRGYELRDAHLQELANRGMRTLYVANSELADVSASLLNALDAIAANAQVAPHDRVAIVQVSEAPSYEGELKAASCRRAVESARRIGARLASLIVDKELHVPSLFAALQHDERPSIRATNGAAYGLVLAERMGVITAATAAEFAAGALLRDIGERHIPSHILSKPTRLALADRQLLESHASRGFVDLQACGGMTRDQLMVVYQHHEHVAGGGYPVDILADEIHPWAQVMAVADAFEGLTGRRPWRDAMSVSAALENLQVTAGVQFNLEMVQCWLKALST